jgi:prophage tail gpP-like protein
MSFKISVNGKAFTRWKSVKITKSIDNNCGIFNFSNSASEPLSDYPTREGDSVKILINDIPVITGFVDNVSGSCSSLSHEISVSGRDNIQDLIDSSVPDSAKVTEGPVSMATLCKRIISAIGSDIPVSTNISGLKSFSDTDLQAAGTGESCMSYLVSFARKRQVYLVADGNGGLVIYKPDRNNKASSSLFHTVGTKNNILDCTFRRAMETRYNYYVCRSQDNFGFDPFADYSSGSGCNRVGGAKDPDIRITRYLEVHAGQSMNDSECKGRAGEECNIRRTAALAYVCTIPGVTQSNGSLWDFGQIVTLQDDYASISGEFLIKSVEFSIDVEGGTLSRLELVLPDAYQGSATQTAKDRRKARIK